MSILETKFGELPDGREVTCYRLGNEAGAYVDVLDFGCLVVRLCVPDKDGELRDVVLGYDTLKPYETNGCSFGAIIGRNGNRIAGAKFTIHGKEYTLMPNENDNNLHSGPAGFEKQLWSVADKSEAENSITFSRVSPDGESGFPGEFKVSVTYTFTGENELIITYDGVSDQATVANMTNHSYFNLNGEGSGSMLDQYLKIHAAAYTPVCDSHSIPTGVYAPVAGTVMDFNDAKPIGQDIDADFEQLNFVGGYDHNYVTDGYEPGKVRTIATAYSTESGIAMDVRSDAPCVQLYAGNFINNEPGKNGHVYQKRDGFCLETQVEPNAVNQDGFHSPVIEAGEKYHTVTAYRFYIK
jgi:aldose 1-epimerase